MDQVVSDGFPATYNSNYLKTWNDVGNPSEFYQYLMGVFYPKVYTAASFDADETFPAATSLKSPGTPGIEGSFLNSRGFISGTHKILAVRLSQVRATAVACDAPSTRFPTETSPKSGFEYGSSTPLALGRNWTCVRNYNMGSNEDLSPFGYPTGLEFKPEPNTGNMQGPTFTAPITGYVYYTPPFQVDLGVLETRHNGNYSKLQLFFVI